VGTFDAHTEPIYEQSPLGQFGGIDWSQDGKFITTSGMDDCTLKLWEVQVEE
jgi:hypothetical protein